MFRNLPRYLTAVAAAALAGAAWTPARADIVWQFQVPGKTDTVKIITDGLATGGTVGNGKYNVLDVIITASDVFGSAVVDFSVLGGQLSLGTNGGASTFGNFLLWHGAGNRFEINDSDANLAGTYGSGSWMDIKFNNPGALGFSGGYQIYTWFGGGPNQMFAVRNNVFSGGALSTNAVTPAAVPEPATLLLSAVAIAALLALGRRRPAGGVVGLGLA